MKRSIAWSGLCIALATLAGCGGGMKQEQKVQIVDYHVHLKGALGLDDALAISRVTGVRFGIAQNCGKGFPVTDDAGLLAYVESMRGKGVFVAMQAEGREWVTMFSPQAIARCDYVFTDSMTWRDDKGRRMRLWVPNEVFVDDKQQFMDMLVERTVWILENEPIDIYVNPTFLPAVIAEEYDALWTDQRMDRVIDAAVRNGVAIEINTRYRLPSERFIGRAKQAGATFACGTNNGGANDLGDWSYCEEMITRYGLTPEDMFCPRPDGQKAIQRKPLPKLKY
ncbi:MAG: hypothetical protein JW828_00990 [Sedimentisphaerales bacterium]|nr:hypothetical protein [Sedimentisphaerales bacterium]